MTDTSTVTDGAAELQSKNKQRFEIVAAVLLGLATVAIAWGSYQANLWGGLQDKALTESARLSTDAASEYAEAGAIISLDQTLFVEVVLQLNQPGADEDAAYETVDFITTNMSEQGETAVNEWFDNDLDFPFTDAYYQSFYAARRRNDRRVRRQVRRRVEEQHHRRQVRTRLDDPCVSPVLRRYFDGPAN